MRKAGVEVCRQAVALESNDLRLKHVLARALTDDGQRGRGRRATTVAVRLELGQAVSVSAASRVV